MVDVGEHYRLSGTDQPPGVYRVVGTADEVVLLHVTDGDGRRIHAGTVVRLSAADLEAGADPAADPDARFDPIRGLRNAASGLYWSVRRFF